jgi:ribosomal protein S18 acetylase RimI-like enzyme
MIGDGKLEIRIFRSEDMTIVLQLANMYAAFDGTTSEADLVVSRFFPNGFWIAEDSGRVVGVAFGYFKDVPGEVLTRWGASKVGEITLVVVDANHRNKGIGTALLHRVLEELKKAGADRVILHCPAEAIEAKRLYDKLGFNTRAYHMTKRL